MTTTPKTRADAKHRAGRTAFQGAVAVLTLAVISTVIIFFNGNPLTPENVFELETYNGLFGAIAVAIIMTGLSYAQRMIEGKNDDEHDTNRT